MKKAPILLSTLTIMTGVSGLANVALTPSLSAIAAESSSSDIAPDIYSTDLWALKDYFRLEKLDFKNNHVVYEVGGTANSQGIRAQRAIIAMRDYTSGVTEEEADSFLPSLGVGDKTWYKAIIDDTKPSAINYNYPKTILLRDNLPDVLYVAVQYGHETTDESGKKMLEGEYWVRTKVDYRRCIHSAVFDIDSMTCGIKYDSGTQTAKLVAAKGENTVFLPEDEIVVTWKEELKQDLKLRVAALNTQLVHMKTKLSNMGPILYWADIDINNMQKSTTELENSRDLDKPLKELRTLLQNVKYIYDWMIGEKQQENMDTLQAELNAVRAELEQLKQDTTGTATEMEKLRQELAEMAQKWQNAQNSLEISEAESQTKQLELDTVLRKLGELQTKVEELQGKLARAEKELSNTVAHADTVQLELVQIKEQITKIKQEKEVLMQQIQVLTVGRDNWQEEKAKLEQEQSDLKMQNQTLNDENAALRRENEGLLTRIRELETSLAIKSTCTMVGEVRVGGKPLDDSSMKGAEEMNDILLNDVDESNVEIPNLGGVETKTNFWWIAVAVVGVLGGLGLYCKKRFGREH